MDGSGIGERRSRDGDGQSDAAGRRRRRRWTAAEKAWIVEESTAPGANLSEVAGRYGVGRGLLTVWRRQAEVGGAGGEAAVFVPVEISTPATADLRQGAWDRAAGADTGRIEIVLGDGSRLVLHGVIEPALATAVVLAMRGRV